MVDGVKRDRCGGGGVHVLAGELDADAPLPRLPLILLRMAETALEMAEPKLLRCFGAGLRLLVRLPFRLLDDDDDDDDPATGADAGVVEDRVAWTLLVLLLFAARGGKLRRGVVNAGEDAAVANAGADFDPRLRLDRRTEDDDASSYSPVSIADERSHSSSPSSSSDTCSFTSTGSTCFCSFIGLVSGR